MGPGKQRRGVDPPLRRLDHPVLPDHQALRLVGHVRRLRRHRCDRGGHRRRHPRHLLRVDRQPRRLRHRPAGDRRHRRRRRHPAHRRQHVGDPLPHPAHRARRHPRRELDHQVPHRQRHGHRRRRRRLRPVRLVGVGQVPVALPARARLPRPRVPRGARRDGLHLPRHRHRPARPRHDHEPAGRALHAARASRR